MRGAAPFLEIAGSEFFQREISHAALHILKCADALQRKAGRTEKRNESRKRKLGMDNKRKLGMDNKRKLGLDNKRKLGMDNKRKLGMIYV